MTYLARRDVDIRFSEQLGLGYGLPRTRSDLLRPSSFEAIARHREQLIKAGARLSHGSPDEYGFGQKALNDATELLTAACRLFHRLGQVCAWCSTALARYVPPPWPGMCTVFHRLGQVCSTALARYVPPPWPGMWLGAALHAGCCPGAVARAR